MPMGWRVQLFENADFTGASATFQEGTVLLSPFSQAKSAIVEEPVEVYVDPNYKGAVGKLLPGCWDYTALGVPEDSISSFVIPAGMEIFLYKNRAFDQYLGVYNSSQSSLASSLNDQISGICVVRI